MRMNIGTSRITSLPGLGALLLLTGCASMFAASRQMAGSMNYVRQHKGEGLRQSVEGSEEHLMALAEAPMRNSGIYTVVREPHAIFASATTSDLSYAYYFYPSQNSGQTDVEILIASPWLKAEQIQGFQRQTFLGLRTAPLSQASAPAAAAPAQSAPAQPGLSKEDLESLVKAAVAGAMQAQTPKPEPRPAVQSSDVDDPSSSRPERPHDFALVVGVESYQDKDLPKADYAERDAEAASRYFLAMGVPRRNLKLLKGSDATAGKMKGFLESWLPKVVSEDSRVYFYFSGHGAPDPSSGDAYLLPWDGNPEYLDASAAPLKRVYENLGRLKAREVLVVMDACFSGTGGRSVIQKGTRPLVMVKTEDPAQMRNLTVLAASRANEVTGSLDEQGHGIFTYYLLKGLKEGVKDSSRLCEYLTPKVQDAAARQNRTQTPVCHGGRLPF